MVTRTTLQFQTVAAVQDVVMIRVMLILTQTATTHHTLLVIPMKHTSTHIVPYLEAPCELIGTFGTTTTA